MMLCKNIFAISAARSISWQFEGDWRRRRSRKEEREKKKENEKFFDCPVTVIHVLPNLRAHMTHTRAHHVRAVCQAWTFLYLYKEVKGRSSHKRVLPNAAQSWQQRETIYTLRARAVGGVTNAQGHIIPPHPPFVRPLLTTDSSCAKWYKSNFLKIRREDNITSMNNITSINNIASNKQTTSHLSTT